LAMSPPRRRSLRLPARARITRLMSSLPSTVSQNQTRYEESRLRTSEMGPKVERRSQQSRMARSSRTHPSIVLCQWLHATWKTMSRLRAYSDASRCPERAQKSGGWCSQAILGATHDSQSDHRISRDQRTAGCSFTGFSWNRLRHPDYGLQSRVLQERNT
jgi:hypothetical protein